MTLWSYDIPATCLIPDGMGPLMSRNAHNNKIGKITKYRRQFDDFYNFGKYGDCGEFLSNHQMYVNQFHTWCPAMLANMAILANSCQITKFM